MKGNETQVEELIQNVRMRKSTYDKKPYVQVSERSEDCIVGWSQVCAAVGELIEKLPGSKKIVVLEAYHGVDLDAVESAFTAENYRLNIDSRDSFLPAEALDEKFAPYLGNHPVFGVMSSLSLSAYLNESAVEEVETQIQAVDDGVVFVFGPAASLLVRDWDLLIYADMARWEIQQRMRQQILGNLGCDNQKASIAEKYKRGYFVDWRACDLQKKELLEHCDFVLDTNEVDSPKLVAGDIFRDALAGCSQRPFRVVPFFDPGVWGGQWMRDVCDLSPDAPNYAWCFDCVPEENSLLLGFGDHRMEIPSINLVFRQPKELLGVDIYNRFGAEFPIRFDFLDTVEGGNLSLQVHPDQAYIQEHFGLPYTQDESYYMLDTGEEAVVYLGTREGIDPQEMIDELERAQTSGQFDAEKYVNKFTVDKHDHVLIPAGTVHCSGKNCMVLEISATPYIFTFKLWDWGRVDLDGKPRPISIEHGKEVIDWSRSTSWVKDQLLNQVEPLAVGEGWREERTGLHASEFIETRRHWFTKKVEHNTEGNLNVLNLVSGDAIVVESPTNQFEPYTVHYAETFIVPAAVGAYTIRPKDPNVVEELATIKAFVRPQ